MAHGGLLGRLVKIRRVCLDPRAKNAVHGQLVLEAEDDLVGGVPRRQRGGRPLRS